MGVITSAAEAVKVIKSNDRVLVHGVNAVPFQLVKAMVDRADELRNVEICHIHTEEEALYARPEYKDSFFTNAFFIGGNMRKAMDEGRADYIPIFLSEVPGLIRKDILPIDVALLNVSPPDEHGYCSLGVSLVGSLPAVEKAKVIIAQINPQMPRAHGNGFVHVDQIDYMVEVDEALPEQIIPEPNEIEMQIGKYCTELIEDGATMQMGIGAIPNAVLKSLVNHKNLGVHTEMFADGVIDLVEKGVINGSCKKKYTGKVVSGFVMGSKRVYDFLDDNPSVAMLDIAYINDPAVVKQNPKVTAINSAIEIDVTGQVCADSIGTRHFSGVGGQMDFIRGAALSDGGKPIIALPSTTRKGISRIVNTLKVGAGVVTTRAHVHYVVTEWGIAYLYGKNLYQRAQEMVKIAHPDHREALDREIFERFKRA